MPLLRVERHVAAIPSCRMRGVPSGMGLTSMHPGGAACDRRVSSFGAEPDWSASASAVGQPGGRSGAAEGAERRTWGEPEGVPAARRPWFHSGVRGTVRICWIVAAGREGRQMAG